MRDNTKKYGLIILINFAGLFLQAQEQDSLYYFSGQVVSENSDIPIPFVHIINKEKHWGVGADTLGFFNIWVKPGDTLNISALGFEYLQYGVNEIVLDSLVEIHLQTRFYDIPEVSIYYLGTYKDFEYKVLNLELPKSKINPEFKKLFRHVEPPPFFAEPKITSPASLIYAVFSKEAKDIKKSIKLNKEGEILKKVYLRYNEDVVSNLTGLSKEEAFKLIKFCNFQNEYILSIDDYNLYSEILLRYEAFKKSKDDSLKRE
ncbi:MAG: hypothetical protein PF485_04735 [Bacteroidales bacterium]|jgi:hypothetical protein|nr:hypothetical protein [Bacteroidales bacterium]